MVLLHVRTHWCDSPPAGTPVRQPPPPWAGGYPGTVPLQPFDLDPVSGLTRPPVWGLPPGPVAAKQVHHLWFPVVRLGDLESSGWAAGPTWAGDPPPPWDAGAGLAAGTLDEGYSAAATGFRVNRVRLYLGANPGTGFAFTVVAPSGAVLGSGAQRRRLDRLDHRAGHHRRRSRYLERAHRPRCGVVGLRACAPAAGGRAGQRRGRELRLPVRERVRGDPRGRGRRRRADDAGHPRARRIGRHRRLRRQREATRGPRGDLLPHRSRPGWTYTIYWNTALPPQPPTQSTGSVGANAGDAQHQLLAGHVLPVGHRRAHAQRRDLDVDVGAVRVVARCGPRRPSLPDHAVPDADADGEPAEPLRTGRYHRPGHVRRRHRRCPGRGRTAGTSTTARCSRCRSRCRPRRGTRSR